MAIGILACTSEETPTEPAVGATPELAGVKTYTTVDLGTLGGTYGYAFGINPTSEENDSEIHAFLWEKGVMTDLGTLGGDVSQAESINPAGQVVGRSETGPERESHAFLWEKGIMTDLGPFGGNPPVKSMSRCGRAKRPGALRSVICHLERTRGISPGRVRATPRQDPSVALLPRDDSRGLSLICRRPVPPDTVRRPPPTA